MSRPNRFAGLASLGLAQGQGDGEEALTPDTLSPARLAPDAPSPAPAAPAPAQTAPQATTPPQPAAERLRMLGGRVPDSVFREFGHAKLDAEAALRMHRVTTEEAVEAFVRMLRDPDSLAQWHAELRAVRAARRG